MQDLCQNPYPGRGIVIGLDESAQYIVQIYWIMGRSENSRNRIFAVDNETGRLYTKPADPKKIKDPSLIIYNAMRGNGEFSVVSNGDQTDTVMANVGRERPFSLDTTLLDRAYEPDEPNFTQRITAVCQLTGKVTLFHMSILRRSELSDRCDRSNYQVNPTPGYGYCITTYASDSDPLPPFRSEPLLVPIMGNMQEIAQSYWGILNKKNRVSLAVKVIEKDTGDSDVFIINKYTEVT